MDLFSEIRTAVYDDLTSGSESSLYSTTKVNSAINRAYRKSGALFPWPELMDAKKTTTVTDQEYYDYPDTWRSNSIWKLTVTDSAGDESKYGEDPDGSPLTFSDYLNWKEDYPNSTDKKWANQERRYFVWPVPSANGNISAGTNVISVWGIMNVTALSADSDTTIFSYHMPEGNEAVVLEAVAILKNVGGDNKKSDDFRSVEAKQILSVAWSKIIQERAKYEKNQPLFYVQDYFSGNSTADLRGKFNVRV